MSTSNPKRRKASNAGITDDGGPLTDLNSLDLLNPKTTPKVIATALLSLLPPGATTQVVAAKKLERAFAVFSSMMVARSNIMAQDNQAEGERLPFVFRFFLRDNMSTTNSNKNDGSTVIKGDAVFDQVGATVIQMPSECFIEIMTFLNGRETVTVSTVNKAWLAVSRMPTLWTKLDKSNGLSDRMNQTTFLSLLKRPQFNSLKFLAYPLKTKPTTSMIPSIAKACPLLETWDVGYSYSRLGHGRDGDLTAAAQKFANLSSIRTSTWEAKPSDIMVAVKVMGEQLLDLRIKHNYSCMSSMQDVLQNLATYCPNLKYLTFIEYGEYYSGQERLRGEDIINLVRICRRLEVLELNNTHRIERTDFETILTMLAQDPRSFALRKIDVVGYPFIIRSNPFAIINT